MSDVPAKLIEEEEKPKACVSESIFENMKNTLIKNLSEEDRKSYQEFGEKFHRTLDTMGFQTGKKESVDDDYESESESENEQLKKCLE